MEATALLQNFRQRFLEKEESTGSIGFPSKFPPFLEELLEYCGIKFDDQIFKSSIVIPLETVF